MIEWSDIDFDSIDMCIGEKNIRLYVRNRLTCAFTYMLRCESGYSGTVFKSKRWLHYIYRGWKAAFSDSTSISPHHCPIFFVVKTIFNAAPRFYKQQHGILSFKFIISHGAIILPGITSQASRIFILQKLILRKTNSVSPSSVPA